MNKEEARAIVMPLLEGTIDELVDNTMEKCSEASRVYLADCFRNMRLLVRQHDARITDLIAKCLMTGEGFGEHVAFNWDSENTVLFVSVIPAPREYVVEYLSDHGFDGRDPPDMYGKWWDSITGAYSFEQFPRQIHLVWYCDAGVMLPRMGAIVDIERMYESESKWFYSAPYEFADSSLR